jgi:hypothetical protein
MTVAPTILRNRDIKSIAEDGVIKSDAVFGRGEEELLEAALRCYREYRARLGSFV